MDYQSGVQQNEEVEEEDNNGEEEEEEDDCGEEGSEASEDVEVAEQPEEEKPPRKTAEFQVDGEVQSDEEDAEEEADETKFNKVYTFLSNEPKNEPVLVSDYESEVSSNSRNQSIALTTEVSKTPSDYKSGAKTSEYK